MGDSFPWVAVDPTNGTLYTSQFGDPGIKKVFRFDTSLNFLKVIYLSLPVQRVQGGSISPNGRLFLSSDSSYDIRMFALSNGQFLGSLSIAVDPSSDEEVEGVAYHDLTLPSGSYGDTEIPPSCRSQVHVVLLDNDFWSGDDVYFRLSVHAIRRPPRLRSTASESRPKADRVA